MYPVSLEKLIECFRTLPGVGEKTAERYALLISEQNAEQVNQFAQALVDVKTKLNHCSICGNLCESDKCDICTDTERDHQQIFVVQSAKDVAAMEKTGEYHGVYHVLNGLISGSKGVMPEDLKSAIPPLYVKAISFSILVMAMLGKMHGMRIKQVRLEQKVEDAGQTEEVKDESHN